MDEDPAVGPRTVNEHRQVLSCVFERAMRDDTFGLLGNPASRTDKRREPDPKPLDFYKCEEIEALVARCGYRAPVRARNPLSRADEKAAVSGGFDRRERRDSNPRPPA